MHYKIQINAVILALRERGIEVTLLDDEEGIEIGELKNGRITINTKTREDESLLFTLGHLFGHYVQFRDYEKYKHLNEKVEEPKPMHLTQLFEDEFWEYEKEAFQIGKGLIMEVTEMPEELERKYEIFMHTDFEFFFDFLKTGINTDPQIFNSELKKRYNSDQVFEKYMSPISVAPNLTLDSGMNVQIF
jgi:hypothetical protein